MHKGVILLVEAKNDNEARNKANKFMEEYQDKVCDWFTIGGRWTGTLIKYNPYKDKRNMEVCNLCNGTGLRNDSLGISERIKNPKYGCNGCGEWNKKGKYIGKGIGKKLKFESNFLDIGNVIPLKECLEIVKKWQQTEKDGLKKLKQAKRWLKPKNNKDDYNMYGYCLKKSGEILQQVFSFETNVFNTIDYNFSIPKEIDKFYAVMIDMHN